jgi:hypothetical protein
VVAKCPDLVHSLGFEQTSYVETDFCPPLALAGYFLLALVSPPLFSKAVEEDTHGVLNFQGGIAAAVQKI